MPNWNQADTWFTSEAQRDSVADIIMTRLADDHFQDECRYLLRFWWHLHVNYCEVSHEELQAHVSDGKLRIIERLLAAIDQRSDAVERWIADGKLLSRVVDRRDEGA